MSYRIAAGNHSLEANRRITAFDHRPDVVGRSVSEVNPSEVDRMGRHKVLFVGEGVTLSHVVRPMTLAASLDPARYEVAIACDARYRQLVQRNATPWYPIRSISTQQFCEALAKGKPAYDLPTLHRYVQDDLALLERTKPDLVVGDFRISLAVSARLAAVPYWALTNAYWSPHARHDYRVPELPLTRAVGARLGQRVFGVVRPLLFRRYAAPLNALRRAYGLPQRGVDLHRLYTDADQALYTDLPDLVPTFGRPQHHRYIGPVMWSPEVPLPSWWSELPQDRPLIYVSLGSSGRAELLQPLLTRLASLGVSVVAAAAGAPLPRLELERTWVADYLPGDVAARRADVVVCNGGSLSTYQALAAGKPVLGIPSNFDQHLNMGYVERAGLGLTLRSERVKATTTLCETMRRLLNHSSSYHLRAAAMKRGLRGWRPATHFSGLVSQQLCADTGGYPTRPNEIRHKTRGARC